MGNQYADSPQGCRELLADLMQLGHAQLARMVYAPDPQVDGVWAAVDPQNQNVQFVCYLREADAEEVQFTSDQLADFMLRSGN